MTERKYFGTDGIRGRVGEGAITPEFVLKLGWAAGRVLGKKPGAKVVIGKDTRISGYMFESALEAGLVAAGVNIYLLGPMPTPGIAYLTRTLHAQAGIVISASHNPYYDNGIKFFSAEGKKLPDSVEFEIERELERELSIVDSQHLGKAYRVEDAPGRYVEFCKGTIPWDLTFPGLKLVVDCANGATYHIAPYVFEELGAQVTAIGDEPNGLNINEGVGSTHIETLRAKVLETGADVGVALDGDGDRLIMVDANGEVLDGDDILYVIARGRHAKGKLRGSVVGTLMTNLGLEQAFKREGIGFARTQVGDRYVLEKLEAEGWALGGESSGHIICLDRTTTGDGVVSALQVLAQMQIEGKPLAELKAGLTKYPQELINVRVGQQQTVMDAPAVQDALRQAEAELGDAGRILLRPSGTEPLIRVMAEGADGNQVRNVTRSLAAVIEGIGASS